MPGTVTEAAVAETRNMPGPDYWYSKKPVPDRAKEKIGKMVRGTAVGEVGFSGLRKELLKVDGGVFSAVFTENRKYLYRGEVYGPFRRERLYGLQQLSHGRRACRLFGHRDGLAGLPLF